jgi:hypothetical protein
MFLVPCSKASCRDVPLCFNSLSQTALDLVASATPAQLSAAQHPQTQQRAAKLGTLALPLPLQQQQGSHTHSLRICRTCA